jgi:hypothetical protein
MIGGNGMTAARLGARRAIMNSLIDGGRRNCFDSGMPNSSTNAAAGWPA